MPLNRGLRFRFGVNLGAGMKEPSKEAIEAAKWTVENVGGCCIIRRHGDEVITTALSPQQAQAVVDAHNKTLSGAGAVADKRIHSEHVSDAALEQLRQQLKDDNERSYKREQELHKQLQQAEADTKRLDWLLSHKPTSIILGDCHTRAAIDAAIDAAMKQ